MSDPLNLSPRRLVPQTGPTLWTGTDMPTSQQMIPLGAEHAAELEAPGLPTPRLDELAVELHDRLDHGHGFALLRGLPRAGDLAVPIRELARRLGEPVPAAPSTGRRHVEACDALLLRVPEATQVTLRSAAALHNALLHADRAALSALYEKLGEHPMPVFSADEGLFAARWDDEALPPSALPPAFLSALEDPDMTLTLDLRAGDIIALNPFLAWADRIPGAAIAAARSSPSRLDTPAFSALR
jgi:hypothetical protein